MKKTTKFQKLFYNRNINDSLMDIRLTTEMKALFLTMISHHDADGQIQKIIVGTLHNWILCWNDEFVKIWPDTKIVKDTLRLYEHLDSVHGVNEYAHSFIKEMNRQMQWTGVSMSRDGRV